MRPNSTMLFGRISVSMRQPRANLARSPAPVPFPAASVSAAHSPNIETEVNMSIINLRDFYPYYTADSFIEVPDEVAEATAEFDRKEAAYRLRTYQHKAYYSLTGRTALSTRPCSLPSPHVRFTSVMKWYIEKAPRDKLARSVEKDEGAALFAGRCLFVFPHRTRGKRKASTPIRKGDPDGTICNLPERNKNRPLPRKDDCAGKPYPGADPRQHCPPGLSMV